MIEDFYKEKHFLKSNFTSPCKESTKRFKVFSSISYSHFKPVILISTKLFMVVEII